MKQIYLLTFFIGISTFGQETWNDFTGKEKAFLYHQARRVEILNAELFPLFDYLDSIPFINDTLKDYGYVEKQIVLDGSLLQLHTEEMSRKSVGLVMDLAVRYALWELDQVLQYRNSTADADKPFLVKLKTFEKYVIEASPQSALRMIGNGDYELLKKIDQYYSASLTVSDKLAAILNSGYSQLDQMLIINAVMAAEEKYVGIRAQEIFVQLGGRNLESSGYLSAVGDGSNWAEIVGGFNTPYTIGLPDEKGLFRFMIKEEEDKEHNRTNLVVSAVEHKDLVTDSEKETVIHIDIFGYHPERQTTIAIQKGGNSYVLYGKNDQRLVSPDSTYGEGTTYWRLMYNLEHFYIDKLKEDLYGKRGYEYQIDLYEKKIETTKIQIKATEYRLDKLRHTPEGKPKIKKKKHKKKNLGMSDQDGKGHPTSALSKLDKKKNIEQNRLIQLNNQLTGQKTILAQLKEDMEKAYENLVKYEAKLDYMRKNIGYIIMEYKVDHDFYRFKDGATFNYRTQDFTFAPTGKEEAYQLYHISFGKEVFDDKIDENFARIHISKSPSKGVFALQRKVGFEQNLILTPSDSVQIMELFRHLATAKSETGLTLVAGGIKTEGQRELARDSEQRPIGFNSDAAKDARLIHYFAQLKASMEITITGYSDAMIRSDFTSYNAAYLKLKSKYPELNEVDFYTGMMAKKAANDWISLLKSLVPKWVKDTKEQKMILSQLKKLKVGKISFLNGSFESLVPDL